MAFVSEYHSTDGSILPYGYGETSEASTLNALRQIAGAPANMKAVMKPRIKTRELGDDEASEVAEYLETPW